MRVVYRVIYPEPPLAMVRSFDPGSTRSFVAEGSRVTGSFMEVVFVGGLGFA